MSNKITYTKIVTPIGVSQYVWLTEPDVKFGAPGHYKTNLIVDGKEAEALVKSIGVELKKSIALGKEKSGGKDPKQSNLPYEAEFLEGLPTGKIIFKFKTKAEITTKDGKTFQNKVAIFDSKGHVMTGIQVWSGSHMKCSAELIPYYTAVAGAGVSMRLRGVQVTKLVEGGSGGSAGHGFDEVKDGYISDKTEAVETTPKVDIDEVKEPTDF
jgi:hypothetical protein